jgi:hypothetical protein
MQWKFPANFALEAGLAPFAYLFYCAIINNCARGARQWSPIARTSRQMRVAFRPICDFSEMEDNVRLVKLSYSEYESHPREWHLKNLGLEKINLAVGKNATGKSRLINVIHALAALLSTKRTKLFLSGTYRAEFIDGDNTCVYSLKIADRKVESERFTIDGEVFLSREDSGEGRIVALDGERSRPRFQSPPDKLAAVAKRDAIQHPFLDSLYRWGRSVHRFQFGTPLGKDQAVLMPNEDSRAEPDIERQLSEESVTPAVYAEGFRKWGDVFDKAIIADMRQLGYRISDVGLEPLQIGEYSGTPIPPAVLFVQETDLKCHTRQLEMSAGMFRALVLTTNLNYLALSKQPVCLLIDDVGEGLDFDRAQKIVSLLIRTAEKYDMQLIMTTNDRFIMNGVPLKYWRVLERTKNVVRVISQKTSPKVFEEFNKIGLANFDFFSRRLFRPSAKK